MTRQMSHKEAKHVYSNRVKDNYLVKARWKELSDALNLGFDLAKNGFKTTSFRFVEHILMKMVQIGVLHVKF